mmetsp:Transcript_138117/g.311314  ORF Transcript_138117/g.311314 Transcript_138117/m.311314 type:complete len:273 (+) Transcript_138117:112-930(+)|eukprot:CAMPEP_0204324760 /NCGR_PEP_ID=MMETSP0469-20131031/10492_1 /ASSEMBLY_ACC=CAM_ASM_000384 /TAXON_ID=2969 /ORGANISM="Oxyrrhis marina" /LENGTH=272 /DNA_ID=CAMNT_0051306479 /DNA_START=74 /DNA_END=892 /DNA_ORIENTATION=-
MSENENHTCTTDADCNVAANRGCSPILGPSQERYCIAVVAREACTAGWQCWNGTTGAVVHDCESVHAYDGTSRVDWYPDRTQDQLCRRCESWKQRFDMSESWTTAYCERYKWGPADLDFSVPFSCNVSRVLERINRPVYEGTDAVNAQIVTDSCMLTSNQFVDHGQVCEIECSSSDSRPVTLGPREISATTFEWAVTCSNGTLEDIHQESRNYVCLRDSTLEVPVIGFLGVMTVVGCAGGLLAWFNSKAAFMRGGRKKRANKGGEGRGRNSV